MTNFRTVLSDVFVSADSLGKKFSSKSFFPELRSCILNVSSKEWIQDPNQTVHVGVRCCRGTQCPNSQHGFIHGLRYVGIQPKKKKKKSQAAPSCGISVLSNDPICVNMFINTAP